MAEIEEAPATPGLRQARLGRQRTAARRWIIVTLLLAIGGWIRTRHLDSLPFWVDEAESSINALTILQHGYPNESYLGEPIYENTHVSPWINHPEYEFRDISYTDRGFAVYHGWLPLYAMAASFALHGIHADIPDGSRHTKHQLADQKRLTRAARLPAVLFAVVFLLVVFLGGFALYGSDAAWAGLIAAVFYPSHLQLSNQARYYSAQVTLTTACCVMLWLVIQKCRWRDIVLAAISYVLLFHTHLLSFATAAVMFALCAPVIIYRHEDWLRKLSVFGVIAAAGTLPWILITGFYEHQTRIPRAWPLLRIPSDLFRYPPFNWRYVVVVFVIFGCILWLRRSGRLSEERMLPVNRFGLVALFTGTWAATGYVLFLLFIPAVSFTITRLNLSYWGPLFLLFATTSAAAVNALLPVRQRRWSLLLTFLLMAVIFVAALRGRPGDGETSSVRKIKEELERPVVGYRPGSGTWQIYSAVFDHLNSLSLPEGSKIYAAPNMHLVLTVYSGLPMQDITPVRKSFLDNYRGQIVYVDLGAAIDTGTLDAAELQLAARSAGTPLSDRAASELSALLYTRDYRIEMSNALAPDLPPAIEPVPAFAERLLEQHRAQVERSFAAAGYDLATRGFRIRTWSDWVAVLKYRYVDPDTRRGAAANYAQRLRGADTIIKTRDWPFVLFRSEWHPPIASAPVHFRMIE